MVVVNIWDLFFILHSPRNLTIEQSEKLTSIVPEYIKKVAVLVKPESQFR